MDAEFETVSATVDTADESESTDAVASAVLKLLQQLGEPELAAAELGSTSPSELFAVREWSLDWESDRGGSSPHKPHPFFWVSADVWV